MSLVGPDGGRAALDVVLTAATIGLCALQVGVCEAALTKTAAYLNARQQFGRPLSTFQGTMLRAADAAIDIEAMRVTWQNAAWRFDTGRDAADAARVAKWQASERGQRTVHATQHLHGGMGADISYPIHRYFLWGKQIELLLGGPSAQLSQAGGRHRGAGVGPGGGGVVSAAARPVRSISPGRCSPTVAVGDELPTLVLPITRTLIVSGRHRQPRLPGRAPRLGPGHGARLEGHLHEHPDHQRVGRPLRHRLVRARAAGCRTSTSGWARRTTPTHHDADGLGHGEGCADRRRAYGTVTVSLRGANKLGDHVTGTVDLLLPVAERGRRADGALAHLLGHDGHRRHRGHRVLQGLGPLASCGWPSRRSPPHWPTPASPRPRCRGW